MGFLSRFFEAGLSALEFHAARYARQWLAALACAIALFALAFAAAAPPGNFPAPSTVPVERGESAHAVALDFAARHIVRSAFLLEALLRLSGAGERVHAGAYRFEAPQNLFAVARRLAEGSFGLPNVRITFFEGETAQEQAARVASALPNIPADDFLSAAQPYEGYLFPDTYIFPPDTDSEAIVAAERANFEDKIAPLAGDIANSGHSLSDIVIMASIVEKEARTSADKRIIAGILWHRIALGMPLQVDAVFGYIYARGTFSPSLAELSVDSPYNTYTHTGLPPGPIGNPGLDAIEAAIHPTKTNYLYYLTGTDGLMHYAATYAGHEANVAKYGVSQ